eukprot:m.217744 g.217744  ORF g.217744 m.217744 type:complete len:111 (+) comp17204_c0_seq46:821-1153(+)
MNHLKAYAIRNGFTALVTYADNDAIGYFAKQGFTKDLTLEPERLGVIKIYSGGVLMQCDLHAKVPYLQLSRMVATQKQHVIGLAQRATHTVYPTVPVGRCLPLHPTPLFV